MSFQRRPATAPSGDIVEVKDDLLSALVRHPTWAITKRQGGLAYERPPESTVEVLSATNIGPEQISILVDHITKAFDGSEERFVLRSYSPSGGHHDLQLRVRPVVGPEGNHRVVGSTTDVTHRAEPGETREQLAKTIVEAALDCIVVLDHRGRIVEFNPAAEQTFGYSRAEALRSSVWDLMPEEMAGAHREGMARHLGAVDPQFLDRRIEAMATRADGTKFPVELTVTRVPDRDRALFVGVLRDISDSKRTREALRDSEQRLSAIADNVPDVIYHFRLKPEPRFEYVSPASAEVLGYHPADFYRNPGLWRRIIPIGDVPKWLAALKGGPSTSMLQVRCIRRDGTEIDCQFANTIIRDRWGEPVASVGVLRDETERIETQLQLQESAEKLQRADAERLRLLRKLVAAHEDERRNIAAAIHDDSIQAVAALAIRVSALRRKTEDPELEDYLAGIETSVSDAVNRLRRLMFDLHPTTLERGGLATTVEAHISLFAKEDDASYTLENQFSKEPPQHVRLALYRVIQEALVNARKHAGARHIVVHLLEDQGEFLARIRDDGRGFEVHEVESPAGHMGLSIMREQAEMASGRISIDSEPGKGTTVEARIPLGPDAPHTG